MNDYSVIPTKAQIKKLDFLLDKGGQIVVATYAVKMPDESNATIDPFGRVEWWPQPPSKEDA